MDKPEFERYLLIPWPASQSLEELPGWEKHTIIATNDSDVGECYLVEESWYLGVMETELGI